MYESYYGFREKPFSLLPDPSFLYFSKKHRLALSLLEYSILNQAGFSVITGGIGTGKTTLLRQLLHQIDSNISIGLISNTHESFGDLLQWVLMAFNLDYAHKSKAERYQIFVEHIIEQYAQNKRTVLIVDEAQNLSSETLEELRMLSNINSDKDQVLQVILVGQAELRETLQRDDLIQFAQRITVDYHLEPLTQDEVHEYIQHRVQVAGGNAALFPKEVADYLYEQTTGVPRIINLLCDTALVYGYAEQIEQVTLPLMQDVVAEKRKGGLFPRSEQDKNKPVATTPPVSLPTPLASSDSNAAVETRSQDSSAALPANAPRILVLSSLARHRNYLQDILRANGIDVCLAGSWSNRISKQLGELNPELILIDFDEAIQAQYDEIEQLISETRLPALFNECVPSDGPITIDDLECGEQLSSKIRQSIAKSKIRA